MVDKPIVQAYPGANDSRFLLTYQGKEYGGETGSCSSEGNDAKCPAVLITSGLAFLSCLPSSTNLSNSSSLIVNSVNQSTKNRIDVLENSDTIIAINIRIVYSLVSIILIIIPY